MKKKIFLFLTLLFCSYSISFAATIYLKDGSVRNAKILFRTHKGTIWVKNSLGASGIDIDEIAKIVGDDGTVLNADYTSLLSSAQNFIVQKKYSDAVLIYDDIVKAIPQNKQIRYLRAMLNQKIGDLESALSDYRFLKEHDELTQEICNNMGVIYVKRRQFNEARVLFEQALRDSPRQVAVLLNLAAVLLEMKEYANAASVYEEIVALQPNNTLALYNLGVAYAGAQDIEKARTVWQKLLLIEPRDADVQKNLDAITVHSKQG